MTVISTRSATIYLQKNKNFKETIFYQNMKINHLTTRIFLKHKKGKNISKKQTTVMQFKGRVSMAKQAN